MRKASSEHPVDQLLGVVEQKFNMNRAEAMAKIGTSAPQMSKMRTDRFEPSARFILKTHDRAQIPLAEIRRILQVQPL